MPIIIKPEDPSHFALLHKFDVPLDDVDLQLSIFLPVLINFISNVE